MNSTEMQSFRIGNYQFLDIPVAAGTYQQINIPDQAQLRDAPILALEVYTANDFPNSFLNSFNPLPTSAQVKACSLQLYTTQGDAQNSFANGIFNIPLIRLHNIVNSTDPYSRVFTEAVGWRVQWQKCSLQFSSMVTFASAVSFCFGIYYPNDTFGNI
jgi:hypothetical protein